MIQSPKERVLLAMAVIALVASAASVTLRATTLPHGAWLWPAVIALVLVAGRALGSLLEAVLFQRRLKSPAPLVLHELPRKEGHVYLGHAFPWNETHLEQFFEVERHRITTPAHPLLGDWRIHAVGPRPRPLFMPVGVLNQHKLIVSTTGGGKSRALELDIVQAIERGDAVIIIDPKGDERLLARAEEAARKHRRTLRLVALPYPAQSARYNPIGTFVQHYEIADRVSLLLHGDGDAAPFQAYAWGVINTVVHGMRLAQDEPYTLYKIKRYGFGDAWGLLEKVLARTNPELYRSCRNRLAEMRAHGDIDALGLWYQSQKRAGALKTDDLDDLVKIICHPRSNYEKMAASLWPKLCQLTTDQLRGVLSPDDTDGPNVVSWPRVDHNREVVYFFLGSLLGYTTASAVAMMTLLDFVSYVGQRYAYQSDVSRRRITVIVDELADVINQAFVNLLNKSRGANVSVIMAAQSLSDLEARLGSRPHALRVLANVNTIVQMLVREPNDARTFSGMTGKVRIRVLDESRHYEPALGDAGKTDVSGHRATFSQSWKTVESELVPESLLQRLCIGHFFAMQNGLVYKGIIPLLPDPPPSTLQRLKEAPVLPAQATPVPAEVQPCSS